MEMAREAATLLKCEGQRKASPLLAACLRLGVLAKARGRWGRWAVRREAVHGGWLSRIAGDDPTAWQRVQRALVLALIERFYFTRQPALALSLISHCALSQAVGGNGQPGRAVEAVRSCARR
jgi:hypothetical protein